jgi:hypothetical protein
MVRADIKERHLDLYFPSKNIKTFWFELAQKYNMSASRLILEMAGKGLELTENGPANHYNNEVKKLREELKAKNALLAKQTTELWKLKYADHLVKIKPGDAGIRHLNDDLVNTLYSGGNWRGPELLDVLGIDPNDSQAMKVLLAQLEVLADFGAIVETANGWRWNKK